MEEALKSYSSYMMPLTARSFFINVNLDEEGRFYGTISQIFYERDVTFSGLADAILKIDNMLDELGCVQSSTEIRGFNNEYCKAYRAAYSRLPKEERIKIEKLRNTHVQYREINELKENARVQRNCFIVDIMYRQHSSWQGKITWRNHSKRPKKEYFRSVLELLNLISSSYEGKISN